MAAARGAGDEGRGSPPRLSGTPPRVRGTRLHGVGESPAAPDAGQASEPGAGVPHARRGSGRLPEGADGGSTAAAPAVLMDAPGNPAARPRDRIPPRLTPVLYFLLAHAALVIAFALLVSRPGEAS